MNDRTKNKAAIISKIGCIAIAIVYGLVLLKLVVLKNGLTTECGGWNFIPFEFMVELITSHISMSVALKNVLGNIFVFVPMGILLAFFFQKLSTKQIVKIGFFISLVIELAQGIIGLGIADVDDLLTNTIGVLLGVILYERLTKSWDHHWENSFATLLMLVFVGLSSAVMLFYFGYASSLTSVPSIVVNEDILGGLDEEHADVTFRCESLKDGKLYGYQINYEEEDAASSGVAANFPVSNDTSYFLKNIKAGYSVNGNVNKLTVTYEALSQAEYENLLGSDGSWVDLWINENRECYAVMVTRHE